jgi:hypothetical protein
LNSRLIFEASEHLSRTVDWKYVTESPYMYCGVQEDLDINLIRQHIDAFFGNAMIYLALNKEGSFETTAEEVIKAVAKLQGNESFYLWSSNFRKVMEFRDIGVFREGEAPNGLKNVSASE